MRTPRLLFLLAALNLAPLAKSAENAPQIAGATFPSVVLLVMEDERGQPVALGSGFFVKEKVVASNFHVVEKAARGYAKLVGQKTKYPITGVVGLDSKHDLVLLALQDASAPSLKLGDGSKVAVGDTVFAVGNPQGLEGTFSQGIVSGVRQFETDSLLQITAPISTGSSGGPVLDSEGRVIGVAAATFQGGQNLNFAIPSKYVDELLQNAGKPEPLPPKITKATKSVLDELGGSKSTEGVTGGSFTYDGDEFGPAGSFSRYSFSLVNQLREPVKNVYCLLVLFDVEGNPIDTIAAWYPEVISPGAAKRILGRVDPSVKRLKDPGAYSSKKKGKIEFRILGFEIAKDQQ